MQLMQNNNNKGNLSTS